MYKLVFTKLSDHALSLRISSSKHSRATGYSFNKKYTQHHFDSSLIRRAETTGITYTQNKSVLLIDSPQGAWPWMCCIMGQLNFHVALRSGGLTRKALDIWKQWRLLMVLTWSNSMLEPLDDFHAISTLHLSPTPQTYDFHPTLMPNDEINTTRGNVVKVVKVVVTTWNKSTCPRGKVVKVVLRKKWGPLASCQQTFVATTTLTTLINVSAGTMVEVVGAPTTFTTSPAGQVVKVAKVVVTTQMLWHEARGPQHLTTNNFQQLFLKDNLFYSRCHDYFDHTENFSPVLWLSLFMLFMRRSKFIKFNYFDM